MQYFDFSSLIEQYSTDFKVICESEGSYDVYNLQDHTASIAS